ncbi:uncharacterized protein FTJAE_13166 [Fusarium tjaetaba]|uniref:Uncharacterized protein n=1 Tax=Fusarium tjaetaba TaxID=1567544 RepID=A0A8H5V9F4_9HYPO|nr:uncharacterized protein FTJAE_13166 [Fusarium tjaetaba]KAF5616037.1 hypothetical protein FTJAE_13166 [Fusarium tjaetaba]
MPNSIFGAWQMKLKKKIRPQPRPQPQPPIPLPSTELAKPHIKRGYVNAAQKSKIKFSEFVVFSSCALAETETTEDCFLFDKLREIFTEDLSSAFQYSRERWARDGSSSSNHTLFPIRSRVDIAELSKPFQQDSEFAPPSAAIDKSPPQLDPLPDMSSCSLERSSTLRACIEAAPEDKSLEDKSLRSTTKCERITTHPKASAALTLQPVGRKTLSITRPLPSCDLVAPATLVGSLGGFNKSGGHSHWQRGQISSNWTQGNSDKPPSMQDHLMQDPSQCSPSRCTSATTFQPPTNILESSYLTIEEGDQP